MARKYTERWTIKMTPEMKKKMKNYDYINWSGMMRDYIREELENLEERGEIKR